MGRWGMRSARRDRPHDGGRVEASAPGTTASLNGGGQMSMWARPDVQPLGPLETWLKLAPAARRFLNVTAEQIVASEACPPVSLPRSAG